MAVCPDCCEVLNRTGSEKGLRWECPHCHGAAVPRSAMMELITEAEFAALLAGARNGAGLARRPCAMCDNYMTAVVGPGMNAMEVCPSCQSTWLKATVSSGPSFYVPPEPHSEAAPPVQSRGPQEVVGSTERKTGTGKWAMPDNLTPEQREKVAQLYVKMLEQEGRHSPASSQKPVQWWRWALLLFGIPVLPRRKK